MVSADGIFYVKIQGNLPLSDQAKYAFGLNQPESIDVVLAQGAMITAPGGHPAGLIKFVLLPQAYYPGYTADSLVDYRYFPVSSEQELNRNGPPFLRKNPTSLKSSSATQRNTRSVRMMRTISANEDSTLNYSPLLLRRPTLRTCVSQSMSTLPMISITQLPRSGRNSPCAAGGGDADFTRRCRTRRQAGRGGRYHMRSGAPHSAELHPSERTAPSTQGATGKSAASSRPRCCASNWKRHAVGYVAGRSGIPAQFRDIRRPDAAQDVDRNHAPIHLPRSQDRLS